MVLFLPTLSSSVKRRVLVQQVVDAERDERALGRAPFRQVIADADVVIDIIRQRKAVTRAATGVIGAADDTAVVVERPVADVIVGEQRRLPLGLNIPAGSQIGPREVIQRPQRVLGVGDLVLDLGVDRDEARNAERQRCLGFVGVVADLKINAARRVRCRYWCSGFAPGRYHPHCGVMEAQSLATCPTKQSVMNWSVLGRLSGMPRPESCW